MDTSSEFVKLYKQLLSVLTRWEGKNFTDYSQYTDEQYIYDFVKYNLHHMEPISVGDVDAFLYNDEGRGAFLIKGLRFTTVLKEYSYPQSIFRILHDLYRCGHNLNVFSQVVELIKDTHKAGRQLTLEYHSTFIENFAIFQEGLEDVLETEARDNIETIETGEAGEAGVVRESSDVEEGEASGAGAGEGEASGAREASGAGEGEASGAGEGEASGAGETATGTAGDPFATLMDSSIGQLAQNICEDMSPDDLEQLSNLGANGGISPMNFAQSLFGQGEGGNPNPLANIMQKTISTLHTKINNGEIDLQQMAGEMEGMMPGGLAGMMEMFAGGGGGMGEVMAGMMGMGSGAMGAMGTGGRATGTAGTAGTESTRDERRRARRRNRRGKKKARRKKK